VNFTGAIAALVAMWGISPLSLAICLPSDPSEGERDTEEAKASSLIRGKVRRRENEVSRHLQHDQAFPPNKR
jgi:hypothetical protein